MDKSEQKLIEINKHIKKHKIFHESSNQTDQCLKSKFLIEQTYDIYFNKKCKILDVKLFKILGNEYFFNEKYNLAEKYYIIGIENNDSTCIFNLAVLYNTLKHNVFISNNIEEDIYLHQINNGNTKVVYDLALLYKNKQKYDLAMKYYKQFVNSANLDTLENNDVNAMIELALLCKNIGDLKETFFYLSLYKEQKKSTFKHANKFSINHINKIYNETAKSLANLYFEEKKYDLAEKYYDMLTELHDDIYTIVELQILYFKLGKYDLSEKYCIKGINKSSKASISNLAILYKFQKKYDLAEKYYLMAIKNNDVDSMLDLAGIYETQKKYLLARKYYLLAIKNKSEEAAKRLENMHMKQI